MTLITCLTKCSFRSFFKRMYMQKTSSCSMLIPLLSWNLDGLDSKFLKERTDHVIDYIKRHNFGIVLLQELVPKSYQQIMSSQLCKNYEFAISSEPQHKYFVGTLLRRDMFSRIKHNVEVFENSVMHRKLLITQATYHTKMGEDPVERRLVIMNTHLESLNEYSTQRMSQLKSCLNKMNNFTSDDVIFGGDMNLDEKDDEEANKLLPSSVNDVWVQCGADESTKYSWDLNINTNKKPWPNYQSQYRFDRIFHRGGGCMPRSYQLCGMENLESLGYFPSDHFGIIVTFETLAE